MVEDQVQSALTHIADQIRTNPDMSDQDVMELVGTSVEVIGSLFLLFLEKLDIIAGEIEELKEKVK